MKITKVEAWPLRMERDMAAAVGMAGSPTALSRGAHAYRWSSVFPCLYSTNFETALIRVTTEEGVTGWGEAQAPLAPEVACEIVRLLLSPVILNAEFQGTRQEIESWWDRMYSTMRVRGQTGGFMLDAISGVDMALWDLAGKIQGKPVSALLSETPKTKIPAYLSGLPTQARRETARKYWDLGFNSFKIFFDVPEKEPFFRGLDDLPESGRIAVDALWRLSSEDASEFGLELDRRQALWLEAPLVPEDVDGHAQLARSLKTPLAIGESYRTRWEMAPFFKQGAVGVFQPDLGRCGITEGMRLAAMARECHAPVVPHISIAFGPQIAAALHYAAAVENCALTEFNPQVFSVANRFLRVPIVMDGNAYMVPQTPGLGIAINEEALAQVIR